MFKKLLSKSACLTNMTVAATSLLASKPALAAAMSTAESVAMLHPLGMAITGFVAGFATNFINQYKEPPFPFLRSFAAAFAGYKLAPYIPPETTQFIIPAMGAGFIGSVFAAPILYAFLSIPLGDLSGESPKFNCGFGALCGIAAGAWACTCG